MQESLGVDVDIPLLPTNSSGNDQWIVITDDCLPALRLEWTSAWRHFDEWRESYESRRFGSCPCRIPRLLRSKRFGRCRGQDFSCRMSGTGEVFVEPNAELFRSSTVVAAAEVY